MTYNELTKDHYLVLDDVRSWIKGKQRFTQYQLANGWAWWAGQSFKNEGMVINSKTGRIYRMTTTREMRNRLIYAVYTLGPEINSHIPPGREHLPACNQRVEDGRGVNIEGK